MFGFVLVGTKSIDEEDRTGQDRTGRLFSIVDIIHNIYIHCNKNATAFAAISWAESVILHNEAESNPSSTNTIQYSTYMRSAALHTPE